MGGLFQQTPLWTVWYIEALKTAGFCPPRAEVSVGEKNNFPQSTDWKHFTVTTPCKVDDVSKLKIRVKIAAHTLLLATPPPSYTPTSPLLPLLSEVWTDALLSQLWRTLISAGLPAFSRTRSGERDDGRRRGWGWVCVWWGWGGRHLFENIFSLSSQLPGPSLPAASNWVESTTCFIEVGVVIEVSIISVPRYPCQTGCLRQ